MPILGSRGAASAKAFGFTSGASPTFYVAVSHSTSPYISIYPWTSAAGFGSKISNPASLPAGNGQAVAFSPTGTEVVVGVDTSPYINAYPWSKTGFGTKFSNPATLPSGDISAVAFNPTGTVLFLLSSYFGGTIYAYNWSSSGFGSLITSVNPGTGANALAVSPDGNNVSAIGGSSPYLKTYPWTGSAFGSAYSGGNPGASGRSVSFSPNNNAVAAGRGSSNGITTFLWTDVTGYGTQYTATGQNDPRLIFDKTGNYIFYVSGSVNTAGAVPWNGSGYGAEVSISAGSPVGSGKQVAVSPNNNFVAFAGATSPYVAVYPWAGSSWGAISANPSTLPTGTATGVSVMKF